MTVKETPPPQIQLADISSTAAQTALTHQTSANCQPLSIGSDTLGLSAPTALLRKSRTPAPVGKVSNAGVSEK